MTTLTGKHCLVATKADLSGSRFEDVNMSGWTLSDVNASGMRADNANFAGFHLDSANLAGARLTDCRLDGMTIHGVLVTEMMRAYERTTGGDASK